MTDMMGDFLLRIGAMTQQQIDDVLRTQREGDGRRFGEIAVARGYLHEDSLKRFVEYLEKRKGNPDDTRDLISR
jgi:hypothetical protein